MRPVYGSNLRQAVKVFLVLAADLHENKRHRYVDRKSKFSQMSIDECFSVPSAVFNPFAAAAGRQYGLYSGEEYVSPGCRVYDFTRSNYKGEEVLIDGGQEVPVCRDLIEDVTLTWKGGSKFHEVAEDFLLEPLATK